MPAVVISHPTRTAPLPVSRPVTIGCPYCAPPDEQHPTRGQITSHNIQTAWLRMESHIRVKHRDEIDERSAS